MDDVAAAVVSSSSAQIKKAGASGPRSKGTICRADPTEPPPLVVNRNLARRLALHPGSTLPLRGRCPSGDALPPIAFTITGIADFPFDDATAGTVAGRLPDTARLCQDAADDRADLLLVRSHERRPEPTRRALPSTHGNQVCTSLPTRISWSDSAGLNSRYFRQISVVLSTTTLFFGFLLVAVAADRVGQSAAGRDRRAAGPRDVATPHRRRRSVGVGAARRHRRAAGAAARRGCFAVARRDPARAARDSGGSALLRLRAAGARAARRRCWRRRPSRPRLSDVALAVLPIAETLRQEVVS